MHKALFAFAVTVVATGSPLVAQSPNPMDVVRQFVESFNKGDVKAVVATCAAQASIIDEFPPYDWSGAGACAKWVADYDLDAKKNGITGGVVTLGTARHRDVTGERAYIVVPADYAYTMKGKPMKETGSTLAIALQNGPGGWKITAWSWAKN